VNFTDPYFSANQALTINQDETPDIEGVGDLAAGDSVAVQTGTTGRDWAVEVLEPRGVIVREFPGAPDTYNALEGGQVTGVIFDIGSALEEADNRAALAVVEEIPTGELYGFPVDPENGALLDELNQALADMLSDGTYQAIYDTWFDRPEGSILYEAPALPDVAAIGSEDNPIQVVYVPSTEAEKIVAGGELLAVALNEATGLFFEVSVPTSYAATVEAICAAPATTMGFIPAQAYILGNALCGIDVERKAMRYGFDVYWTAFLVQRDSDIETLADLEGKTWAYPDAASTSGFIVPSGLFASLGIAPAESFAAGGHPGAVRAVYNGEAEFGTVFYSPPIDSDRNVLWSYGDPPDIADDILGTCALNDDGEIVCGEDVFPRDARRNVREDLPDVIQKVRILDELSPVIPNDTLSFGPDFPEDTRADIVSALDAFSADDPEGFAEAFAAYSWTSLSVTSDAEFDAIRVILTAIGYDLEDLG
jgi:phosphonate transport system substrate-binding protein